MRSLWMLMILLVGGMTTQGAGTLGDAIRKKPAATAEEKVLARVQNGQMLTELLKLELTNVLRLPDCAFGAETHVAPEGCVLVLVQGRVRNTGMDSVVFQIPDFVSSSGKRYEEEDAVRYTQAKNAMMGLKLNPGQSYSFVCFFAIPVEEVLNSKLRFEKDLFCWDDDDNTLLPLPLDENTHIQERVSLPQVTDM